MKYIAKFPYLGYYVYEPKYTKSSGRYNVKLQPMTKFALEHMGIDLKYLREKPTTTAYARYMYCVENKVELHKTMQVDHIDGDPTNDVIENLQVLSPFDNKRKINIQHKIQQCVVTLKCPNCGKLFTRRKGNTFLQRTGGIFTSCSKQCAGILRQKLQIDPNDSDVLKGISENVVNISEGVKMGDYKIELKHNLTDLSYYANPHPHTF